MKKNSRLLDHLKIMFFIKKHKKNLADLNAVTVVNVDVDVQDSRVKLLNFGKDFN
jgi:hypothetical protein